MPLIPLNFCGILELNVLGARCLQHLPCNCVNPFSHGAAGVLVTVNVLLFRVAVGALSPSQLGLRTRSRIAGIKPTRPLRACGEMPVWANMRVFMGDTGRSVPVLSIVTSQR